MASTDNSTLLQINNLQIPHSQVVVIYTEWNEPIIHELRQGVREIMNLFPAIQLHEIAVPGCVEIPFAIKQHAAHHHKTAAYIALGCVIKGDTPHFEYVCQSVTQGITQLNVTLNSPVTFGILTVLNQQQAYERLGGVHGHKGKEAAITTLKMIHLNNLFLNSDTIPL
ncbi:MAG: 6,7-dimethyl-8-ribityllumazine synthase [Bacteroidetes bacterium]|jgi:6,7-dimethyl-8-ribityllumazine synthase|nr:6,7-dimethyl-8-ribityllumazine synthase [Bacteroidota bacterium]MBK9480840.1 6,7-dimethyl-8-ribityllumazine synthase [Bacteroidota bacterium]